MKRKLQIVALATVISSAAPANAQSIVDNFNSLKASLKALGRKPSAAPAASLNADQAQQPADADAEPALIGDSLIADDPSDTALEGVALAPRQISTFDLLGFKLGMSPREVGRVARKRKVYQSRDPQLQGSFEVQATALANERLSRSVFARSKSNPKFVYGITKDRGQVNFEFAPEASGPKLELITYTALLNGQTKSQVQAALTAKYGVPEVSALGKLFWCQGMRNCQSASGDTFSVFFGETTVDMALSRSNQYHDQIRASLNARASQIAAQKGKPVAF